jgi:stage II sporulation protein R
MNKQSGFRRYLLIVFAILLLICCWESNLDSSTIFASGIGSGKDRETAIDIIPQESIRLRILANSDSPADQWIKREVRDVIVEEMSQWVDEPQGIEAARIAVRTHLPEINDLVGKTLRRYGFDFSYQVELGQVPFPAKMYGSQIYPAGDYEALRVSIGSAAGQNWWCVLFPPLCFVDSEMIVRKPEKIDAKGSKQDQDSGKGSAANSGTSVKSTQKPHTESANMDTYADLQKPEVHFFLWDLLKKLFA